MHLFDLVVQRPHDSEHILIYLVNIHPSNRVKETRGVLHARFKYSSRSTPKTEVMKGMLPELHRTIALKYF